MAHITLIDDDYASEILAETLRGVGHDVHRFHSVDDVLENIKHLASSDLIVLDVMMPLPATASGTDSGRTAGMIAYRSLRAQNSTVPVLAYTASQDLDVHAVFDKDPNAHFLSKWSTPSMKDLISLVEQTLGISSSAALPRTFIVHGHDDSSKLALKNYLQNTLHLPEPTILHEQLSAGQTVIEKFERHARQSDLVFVILTPDDAVASTPDTETRRARQNVIFELGFFVGMLGRTSGRVFLLYKPPLELPSDLSGVCYIDTALGVEAAGESLRAELRHVLG